MNYYRDEDGNYVVEDENGVQHCMDWKMFADFLDTGVFE